MAGLGKTLLALLEDLARQLGKLRPQFIARTLKIFQALLVGFLLFVQFGCNPGVSGAQRAQLGLLSIALGLQVIKGFAGFQALSLQPFGFPPQHGGFRLQRRPGFMQVGLLLTTGFQLRAEAFLRHDRLTQPLVQQRKLSPLQGQAPLQ